MALAWPSVLTIERSATGVTVSVSVAATGMPDTVIVAVFAIVPLVAATVPTTSKTTSLCAGKVTVALIALPVPLAGAQTAPLAIAHVHVTLMSEAGTVSTKGEAGIAPALWLVTKIE